MMTMDDVENLLDHSPYAEYSSGINGQCMETWNIAIWNNHKLFVSHPYYQDYLWKKICGFEFHWENYYFYWKLFYVLFAIMIFFTYPFVIFIDTIFGNNDLLFQAPNSNLSRENSVKAFYRKIMHRPIFRIIVHHTLECIFLLSLGLATVDPLDVPGQETQFYDYILCVFIGCYLLEDIFDIFRRGWATLSSFWHGYTLLTSTLLCVGQLVVGVSFEKMMSETDDDRSKRSGNDPVNIGAAIFSVGATFALLRPLRWFLFDKSLGPTVVCIIKVIRDAAHIFLIYLIVLTAFSIGLFSMYKPFDLVTTASLNQTVTYKMAKEDFKSFWFGLLSAMFWSLFDPGHPEYVSVKKCGNEMMEKGFSCHPEKDLEVGQVSMEFSHLMGHAMWACYQGITVILLINILIAMMNTTFSKIWQMADTAWKYSKSFYQVEFLDPRAILPPPFR